MLTLTVRFFQISCFWLPSGGSVVPFFTPTWSQSLFFTSRWKSFCDWTKISSESFVSSRRTSWHSSAAPRSVDRVRIPVRRMFAGSV